MYVKVRGKIFHKITKYLSFDNLFNICNYLTMREFNPFLKLITAEVDKSISFPMTCPFKEVKEVN